MPIPIIDIPKIIVNTNESIINTTAIIMIYFACFLRYSSSPLAKYNTNP